MFLCTRKKNTSGIKRIVKLKSKYFKGIIYFYMADENESQSYIKLLNWIYYFDYYLQVFYFKLTFISVPVPFIRAQFSWRGDECSYSYRENNASVTRSQHPFSLYYDFSHNGAGRLNITRDPIKTHKMFRRKVR